MTVENTETRKAKALKVAIASHWDHAKSLTRALKEAGHLGFVYTEAENIPPSMDVIICRWKSTSHNFYNICHAEAQLGRRPVIFRNGVKAAVERVQAVASGTWVQDSMLPSWASAAEDEEPEITPEQAAVRDEEIAKLARQSDMEKALSSVVEKGGLFSLSLLSLSGEKVRDVLSGVPYATPGRVKRNAVVESVRMLTKSRRAAVAARLQEQLQNPESNSAWLYDANGEKTEQVLCHEPMSVDQMQHYAKGLTDTVKQPGQSWHATPPEQVVQVQVVSEVLQEDIKIEEQPPEPVVESKPDVNPEPALPIEVVPEPSQAVEPEVMSDKVMREVGDILDILAMTLDGYGVKELSDDFLARFGVSISGKHLALSVVHMASPNGVCCNGASTKTSVNPIKVTCKACKSTEMYANFAWFHTAMNAK